MIYQRTSYILFLLLLLIKTASGQTGEVRGRIFDHKDNKGIPFANIIVDGKPSLGTTTDTAGKSVLKKIDPGYIRLQVSVLGYERKTTPGVAQTVAYRAD